MFNKINQGIWWDRAWSLVEGCTTVSEGCDNCWLQSMARRFKQDFSDVRFRADRLNLPLKTKKPTAWAVWSDLFHPAVTAAQNALLLDVVEQCPQHIFLVLTKRAARMAAFFNFYSVPDNLWLGVTVENQQTADERIPLLLATPATKRFISVEPMLGEIDLLKHPICIGCHGAPKPGECAEHPSLDLVICGGESGKNARPTHPDWVRSLRDQCKIANVPFFFKQWGEWVVCSDNDPGYYFDGKHYTRVGKKVAGRLLDGQEHSELPTPAKR